MLFRKIKKILSETDNLLFFCVSVFSGANSFFLLAITYKNLEKISLLSFEHIYALYFFIALFFLCSLFFAAKRTKNLLLIWKKVIFTFLPTEVILLTGFYFGAYFNYILKISAGIYLIILGFYLLFKIKKYATFKDFFGEFKSGIDPKNVKKFDRKEILVTFTFIFVAILNLSFGFYHISKFSAVDEPLWTDGRISKYWNNIKQGELDRTNVSDKPGITVALISGIGLNWVDPKDYKIDHRQGEVLSTGADIKKMNFAFRTPILIFNFLMIFAIYFLVKKLLGKEIAFVSYILIALSPILLGISRIINPDSLLWTFVSCSILCYLLYLKDSSNKFLFLAGIFLGFSILTKYVANILYVFFLILIFVEYVVNKEKYSKITVENYLKEKLLNYFIISFFSLLVFYVFFPAAWIKLEYLLQGTLFSQAFQKVWTIFIGILVFILADMFILKNLIVSYIFDFFYKFKDLITKTCVIVFIIFITGALANVFLGMSWYDFESAVASPKTAFRENGFLGLFSANFYSLIFGIAPLALLSIIFFGVKSIFRVKNRDTFNAFFYLILFILFYYLASAINLVSAIIRYQIIIFPIAFIIASIGIVEFLKYKNIKKYIHLNYFCVFLVVISAYSLNFIKPFYFSYASDLLPKKYVLNLKDMGDGSYEAAEYLNSLSDADKIVVWSDKRGVCAFFKGTCYSSFDFEVSEVAFDYFVISSGREEKAINEIEPRVRRGVHDFIRFDKLYVTDKKSEFKLEIGKRPNNFVKIFSADQIENTAY